MPSDYPDDNHPDLPHSLTPPNTPPNLAFSLNHANFFLYNLSTALHTELQPRLAHLPRPNTSAGFHFNLAGIPPATTRVRLLQSIARLAANPAHPPSFAAILHAAALIHPTSNRALILPAATGAGKTTLTATLIHHHFHLLSDDSAALTTSGHLLALPFALMLRPGAWPILQPFYPVIPSLPIHHRPGFEPVRFLPPPPPPSAPSSAHQAVIVFPYYSPTAPATPSLSPLTPLAALCALQSAGFWLPHTAPSIQAFLSWFFATPAYKFFYSSLEINTISILYNLLAS